jgi:hypothetical protein
MGATGSGAGIFAESKGSTLKLVFAYLVVMLCKKKVALLLRLRKSNSLCLLFLVLVVEMTYEFIMRTKMLF